MQITMPLVLQGRAEPNYEGDERERLLLFQIWLTNLYVQLLQPLMKMEMRWIIPPVDGDAFDCLIRCEGDRWQRVSRQATYDFYYNEGSCNDCPRSPTEGWWVMTIVCLANQGGNVEFYSKDFEGSAEGFIRKMCERVFPCIAGCKPGTTTADRLVLAFQNLIVE